MGTSGGIPPAVLGLRGNPRREVESFHARARLERSDYVVVASLLADKDQLARSLARKIATYATGGSPEAGDQSEIEEIVRRIRGKNYGLKSMVHEIVQSRMFREK